MPHSDGDAVAACTNLVGALEIPEMRHAEMPQPWRQLFLPLAESRLSQTRLDADAHIEAFAVAAGA